MTSDHGRPARGDEIPAAIGRPALRALQGAGYAYLADVAAATTGDLLALHGVGPKAIGLLRTALAETGRTFADERPG